MVVVCRDAGSRWYVTFQVDTADPEPMPKTGHAVGVDLGVKDLAVTSHGERIVNVAWGEQNCWGHKWRRRPRRRPTNGRACASGGARRHELVRWPGTGARGADQVEVVRRPPDLSVGLARRVRS